MTDRITEVRRYPDGKRIPLARYPQLIELLNLVGLIDFPDEKSRKKMTRLVFTMDEEQTVAMTSMLEEAIVDRSNGHNSLNDSKSP